MKRVLIENTNIITALGVSTEENVRSILSEKCGIQVINDTAFSQTPVAISMIKDQTDNAVFESIEALDSFTRFERFMIASASDALKNSSVDIKSQDTIIILSSTKGNIDLLEKSKQELFEKERVYLWRSAEIIQDYFNNPNKPIISSNACISGVIALNTARLLLQSNKYKHAVVIGGDILSEFVIAGFQSFQALSPGPCAPFDKERNGLSLGEGFGTVILTTERTGINKPILFEAGSSSNDANHISGPSRTGEGLFIAIDSTLKESGYSPDQIDFISAHGTATDFNDEMEAKAFKLAGLKNVPINSFKGYFGHTLGAAGIIESVLTIESMRRNTLFRSLGFENDGMTIPLEIVSKNTAREVNMTLKTASGFGGCNAAILFRKEE